MRSVLRRTALLATIAAALIAIPTSASASAPAGTAQTTNTARPNTSPAATLNGATVTFTTTTENKDSDSSVEVEIISNKFALAASKMISGTEFHEGSRNGPYALTLSSVTTASELSTGLVQMFISTVGHDTWRFNYSITMTFSDGTSFTFGENNKRLSESFNGFQTPFALTTQVAVPNVIGRNLSSATTALQAAGLTVGTVTHRIDSTCTFVNTVAEENPGAGSAVNTGTPVNLTIGDKPKTPCP